MDVIKEIIMLYYEINNIYLELYKLELNDNKDNAFFLQLVNILKEKIEEEKKLFDRLFKEQEDVFEYLLKLADDDGNEMPFSMRLFDYIRFYNHMNNEIDEFDDEEQILDAKETMSYAKLYDACSKNIFLVYLSFLQEYINSFCFNDIRQGLLNYKYRNSFINHAIEVSLLDFNFDISRINYINLYFLADTLELDKNECYKVIQECCWDTITTTISGILSIGDKEYEDIKRKTVSMNNQCMLRAVLSLLSEREYETVRENINGIVKKLSNDDNRLGILIVDSIFGIRSRDKVRVRKISMRPMEGS